MDFPSRISAALSRTPRRSFFLVLSLCLLAHSGWAAALSLSASDEVATAGYFQLSWQPDTPGSEFQLQESSSADFARTKIIYQGTDTASTISGRVNGDYFYRVREVGTNDGILWSPAVQVSVAHHSIRRAVIFFLIGLIVFVATLLAILQGNKKVSH